MRRVPSERAACLRSGFVAASDASVPEHPRSADCVAIAMRELAQTRIRYGYRKIRVLLIREGWQVGKKLVYRIYREEGLGLRAGRKSRRTVSEHSRQKPRAERPNQVWGLDFVADQLIDGRRFRALTVVDVYTRECMAIEVGQSLKGSDVVRVLQQISQEARSAADVVL